MLIGVLLAINIIVCLGLIGVVLLQRSEGGALGMGGGNSGSFMTARGAGDLLTRITWILFSIFLVISLILTILTGRSNSGGSIVDRLDMQNLDSKTLNAPAAPIPGAPTPTAPATTAPADAQPGAIQAPTPQFNLPAAQAPAAPAPAASAPAEQPKP
ncbi:preprotein translocase subunit SecG [Caulobacter sp. RHG1]|uniref:preprotein translocase subunit SecG n=1 Tax=Caulobacter sp. (strain RHG1) TaxID=2545762 RepID=UPI00155176BC|nr:preprotein translocase subunit SecG [Caulobacter sp. RHG1]NQE61135.1 Protein translocase membrane subunit SecG [Caulobacter sp. RHG1]